MPRVKKSTKKKKTTPLDLVDETVKVKNKTPETNVDGDFVIVELKNSVFMGFNAYDEIEKKKVALDLVKGENKVDARLFETFEDDEFFKEHIIGGGVVEVLRRPGSEKFSKVDI